MSCTRWVLGENYQIVKSPEKVRREMVKKGSREIWDCQEIPRGALVVAAEPSFTDKLQAAG
jgi:hypothetical protein